MKRSVFRQILLLWLAWLIVLLSYQAAVTARYQVQKPDRVLFWTAASTDTQSLIDRPYLTEPFMNAQVGWDSEFYLSIALRGYDDPKVRSVPPDANAKPPLDRPLALNYAFFPVYPFLIRCLSLPLALLGLTPIATATLAGVIISASATLVAMLAMYTWISAEFDAATGWRSVFYWISFPTSFFLTQVYTEGLFVALSLSCLVAVQHQRWVWAGGLAAVATLTRAVGVALMIPMVLGWWQMYLIERSAQTPQTQTPQTQTHKQIAWQWLALLSPLIVHLIWRFSIWGSAFQIVQAKFFNCQLLNWSAAWGAWSNGFWALWGDNPATAVHYTIEFSAIFLGFLACFATLKRYPGLSGYGLFILAVSLTCGTAWSMSRYLLTIPSVFIMLGQFGKYDLFDRIWSLLSILGLALLTALFSFDLWAG